MMGVKSTLNMKSAFQGIIRTTAPSCITLVVLFIKLLPLFQKNLLPPFSGQKPDMEKVCTSNILVPTYQTIQCHNPTDNYLYFPCHEGHKSHVVN
jgi:hypothetical protein